jgi:hypothetical protein
MAWQRFRVHIKGEDPVDVETNARDMASIVMDAANPRPLDIMFQQVHNAMRRQQMSVPRDYQGFLEVLDAIPEALDEEDPDGLDPTQPAR